MSPGFDLVSTRPSMRNVDELTVRIEAISEAYR